MNNININKESKTKVGRESIVKELSTSGTNSYLRDRDAISWSMFNNTSDTEEFKFLTEVGEFALPSKIRRIPIQRSKANILLSQQALRNTKYGIKTIDSGGLAKKLTMMYQSLMMMYAEMANQKYRTIEFQLQQIDSQVQEMQQILQQEPQDAQQAQQQAEIKEQLPQIMYQTSMIKDNMQQAMSMTKEERDKFIRKFKDTYEDLYEVYAKKLLTKIREEMDAKSISTKNLRNKIVSGREYLYTNYNYKIRDLEYESVNPFNVSYPNIEDIEWTHNLPWIVVESFMTKEQIRRNFKLDASQLKILEGMTVTETNDSGAFVTGPGQAVILDNNAPQNKNKYITTSNGLSVKKVWWRADEKIVAVQTPNKHKAGTFFTKFMDNDKELIDTKENSYNSKSGEYTEKGSEKKRKKGDVNTYNSGNGESKCIRFFDKRYFGVNINNGGIIIAGEDRVQPHPQDNYGYTPLPIVGKTFNGVGDSPYSMIWATTELQKQYWIVSYHRELTFALAGASGVVFDMSQKPDGMKKEEWFYHMKLGRYLIQTISKTGARKNTGFNQFSRVDQTLTSSIQYFGLILEQIEAQIGTLMGVPRQREGQLEKTDQVGTFDQSNKQAMLVTEIMFKEHDDVEVKALEQLLNLAIQYKYEPNEVVDITEEESELIKIPYDMNDRKFRLKLINSAKEDIDLEELKRMSAQMTANGRLPFEFLFQIFSIDSIKEMENIVAEQTQKQNELAQAQQESGIQAEAAVKQKEIEIQQQFEAQMKQLDAKLKDADLKLKQMLGNRDLDIKEKKVDADIQQNAVDSQIDAQKAGVDFQLKVEEQGETARSNRASEILKSTELQLEAVTSMATGSDMDFGN